MDHSAEIAGLLADGVLDGGSSEKTEASSLPVKYDATGLGMIAFGIWAYEAGRDMAKVQTILTDRTGMVVPLAQLRSWRNEGSWDGVAVQVHQALEGIAVQTTRSMLTRATVKAAAELVRIIDSPTANDANKLQAIRIVMDRGGFPTLLRGESIADSLTHSSQYDDVSDDDLEAEYRSFNADTYNDRHERIAEQVQHNAFHAVTHTTPR